MRTMFKCWNDVEAVMQRGIIVNNIQKTASVHKLKNAIFNCADKNINLLTEETGVRLLYCGGKFAVDKILAEGFVALSQDEQGQTLGLVDSLNGKHYEARLCIGPTGFLRDVRFYVFDMNAPLSSIRMSSDIIQEFIDVVTKILSKSRIGQETESAYDEFERFCDGYTVAEQFASENKATQLCIIWKERLAHWMTAHPPTAARLIVAAARYPNFCPSGLAMAQASFYAKKLGMDGESWIILKAALMLDTDYTNPDYWNWLGCTFDKANELELAVGCFIESLNIDKNLEIGRKNAWIVGRDLIKMKLDSNEFKGSLECIDRLMTFYEGVDDKDRALMMAATGLCCEGLGLLDEAGERYKLALDVTTDCLVARFGSNRVTSENAEERLRFFKLQLASFPRIPHELGIERQAPIEFIEGYSHGDHWDAVTSGAETFIPHYLPLALEKGEISGHAAYDASSRANGAAESAFLIAYPATGEILGGNLVAKTSTEGTLELWSSYPYAALGESVRLKVASLEEWSNGVEGSVVAYRGGGGTLTFFDPFFFTNKSKYLLGFEYQFIVYGFAYLIAKSEEIVHKISSGAGYELERLRRQEEGNPMQEGETYDVTLGKRSTIMSDSFKYPGEYEFFLPVEMVEYTDFLGEPIMVIKSHINDDKKDIPITIYAAKRLLKGGDVVQGDLISGYLWLQGHLLSEQGILIENEEAKSDSLCFGKISYKKQENESISDEFSYVFYQAISGIDAVRAFVDMPNKIGDEPDYVIENANGVRCFAYGVYFDMEKDVWKDTLDEKQRITKNPWIASHFSPIFILGIGYTRAGEGNAFKYFGWEDFENFLNSASGCVPSTS